jgi:hypothetical protein
MEIALFGNSKRRNISLCCAGKDGGETAPIRGLKMVAEFYSHPMDTLSLNTLLQ